MFQVVIPCLLPFCLWSYFVTEPVANCSSHTSCPALPTPPKTGEKRDPHLRLSPEHPLGRSIPHPTASSRPVPWAQHILLYNRCTVLPPAFHIPVFGKIKANAKQAKEVRGWRRRTLTKPERSSPGQPMTWSSKQSSEGSATHSEYCSPIPAQMGVYKNRGGHFTHLTPSIFKIVKTDNELALFLMLLLQVCKRPQHHTRNEFTT